MEIKIEKIKNLTPHAINLRVGDEMVSINSHGMVRVNEVTEVIQEKPVKIIRKKLSGISNDAVKLMKEILSDTEAVIIVSMLTAKAIKKMGVMNDDELSRIMIIGSTIRDDSGRIIGAESLATIENL